MVSFRSSALFNKEPESNRFVTFGLSYAIVEAVLENKPCEYIQCEQEDDLRGLILASYFRWQVYLTNYNYIRISPVMFFITADVRDQLLFDNYRAEWLATHGTNCSTKLINELNSYVLNNDSVPTGYNLSNFSQVIEYYIYAVAGNKHLYKFAKKEEEIVDCMIQIISRIVELTKVYGRSDTDVGVLTALVGEPNDKLTQKAYKYLQAHNYIELASSGTGVTNKSIIQGC